MLARCHRDISLWEHENEPLHHHRRHCSGRVCRRVFWLSLNRRILDRRLANVSGKTSPGGRSTLSLSRAVAHHTQQREMMSDQMQAAVASYGQSSCSFLAKLARAGYAAHDGAGAIRHDPGACTIRGMTRAVRSLARPLE